MKIKVNVRKTEDGRFFVTENLAFEVQEDLLDYKIVPEVKRLCKVFVEIYNKSNSTAIIDLLEDISNSIQMDLGGEGIRKTITREDYKELGMI